MLEDHHLSRLSSCCKFFGSSSLQYPHILLSLLGDVSTSCLVYNYDLKRLLSLVCYLILHFSNCIYHYLLILDSQLLSRRIPSPAIPKPFSSSHERPTTVLSQPTVHLKEQGGKDKTMPAVPTGLPPPPPPGGDQNRGPTINLVVWIFTGISLACVTARMYGRVFLTRNVGWDDFWIVLSMVSLRKLLPDLSSGFVKAQWKEKVQKSAGAEIIIIDPWPLFLHLLLHLCPPRRGPPPLLPRHLANL